MPDGAELNVTLAVPDATYAQHPDEAAAPWYRPPPRKPMGRASRVVAWYLKSVLIAAGLLCVLGGSWLVLDGAGHNHLLDDILGAVATATAFWCVPPLVLAGLVASWIAGSSDMNLWDSVFCAGVVPFILLMFIFAVRQFWTGRVMEGAIALNMAGVYATACFWVLKAQVTCWAF